MTLYRWFGSRDRLLVEVIWSLARGTLDRADAEVEQQGGERIVGIVTRFLELVITDPGTQRLLGEEGEHAMRLLTRHETDFQPRLYTYLDLITGKTLDAARATPILRMLLRVDA